MDEQGRRPFVFGVLGCLTVSAVTLFLAPLYLPEGYTWIAHTTSEAAGQGVHGAWVSRLGFLLFGLAVLGLAGGIGGTWSRGASFFHGSFGVLMISAAVFSSRSWEPNKPFDPVEDVLHSVSATGMGFAFAFGVAVLIWRDLTTERRFRLLDASAVGASILIPLSMMNWGGSAGLLQRGMFLIAYVWYGREIVKPRRTSQDRRL